MNGPISVHRISTNDTQPEVNEYELTLTYKLRSLESIDSQQLFAEILQNILRNWWDGRRPFSVEMLEEGLYACLKQTQYELEAKKAQEEFGREMVESEDGRSKTAKWSSFYSFRACSGNK